MARPFETHLYELVKADGVRIPNHRFGWNRQGQLDVWIERCEKGERFMSQIVESGATYAVRIQVYTQKCYILRENATGVYRFLDKNDCGFWLHTGAFSGAETFFDDDAVPLQNWLNSFAN
jgi:hypothetical protein